MSMITTLKGQVGRIMSGYLSVLGFLAVSLMMLCISVSIQAAMPVAGHVLHNIAYAQYELEDNQGIYTKHTIQSNRVNVVIDKYYSFELLQDQPKMVEAGAKVTWVNQLINTSNTSAWFDLKTQQANYLSNSKIYVDTNQDGKLDRSDVVVTSGMQLQSNQAVDLLVISDTSVQTPDQTQIDLPVSAQIREDPVQEATVLDVVYVMEPRLKIDKTVDQSVLTANNTMQTLTYTLKVTNLTAMQVNPTPMIVDGQTQSWLLIEDPIPHNTVYEDILLDESSNDIRILHKLSDGHYSTQLPSDKRLIHYAVVGYRQPYAAHKVSDIKIKVKTQPSISQTILKNEAYAFYMRAQAERQLFSNIVETEVRGNVSLNSTTTDYNANLYAAKVNAPLYFKTNASMCNANRSVREQVRVEIQSKLTGDIVVINVMESDENSGLFQFNIPTEENAYKNLQDQILQTLKRDEVTATLTACLDAQGQVTTQINGVTTRILIDPYGIVFDAKTKKPVAGATVYLTDEHGQPVGSNIVFEVDPVTGALREIPAKQITNAAGEFVYPLVVLGNYKILVDTSSIPLNKYTYVSDKTVYPLNLYNGMAVDPDYSYGGVFTLAHDSPALNIDIPIDPEFSATGLVVQKTVRDSSVELGDFTQYSISVTNQGDLTAQNIKLHDTLPRGFSYVANTMRINGQTVADPEGGKGPYLTLGLGDLAVNASSKIEYRVLVGANALNGDGINRARVTDRHGASSNEAQAKVTVRPGVFRSDAFIVGKVYLDCNKNGMQDAGELGVAGVRIYMQDGSYVVTDSEGKYNFYGLAAKTHVLKIDSTTLPAQVKLLADSNRQAGDPATRFADLKRGELHRADFGMIDVSDTCPSELIDTVKQRQLKAASTNQILEKAVQKQLSIDAPNYVENSTRSDVVQGCIANDLAQDCAQVGHNSKQASTQQQTVQIQPLKTPALDQLEDLIKQSQSTHLHIFNLKDGQVLPYAQTSIQIQGLMGAKQRVWVNEQLVPEKQRGKLVMDDDSQRQGAEYIGVALQSGQNTIRVEQLDIAGNIRESQQIKVHVADVLHRFEVITPKQEVMANGQDEMQVVLRVLDKQGLKVANRTAITIETDLGTVNLTDINPNEAGIQTFVEGGEMLIPVIAPNTAGRGKLKISSGLLVQEQAIQFAADLRPLIAVGIVEGSIHFKNFERGNVHAVTANDGFEDELNDLASWGDDRAVKGRAAMFLKGKVKGDYLLTLAYDSDKSSSQRLFRDIQPDEYYPVYGDSAAKGFDAQSTSKLYIRVDKGRSYAMYGDYMTRTEKDEGLALGQYNRSLTGVKVGHASDKVQASAFLAETQSRQIVTENRALGISGPYSLGAISQEFILENSEKVEVLTRDRNNPGLIIARQSLNRFSDYEIDSYSNSIYLKQAVASVDQNLNPNYIRITVEAEEIGEAYQVGGASFSYQLNQKLKVGGSFVQSNDPLQKEQIASLNTVMKWGQHGKVIAEIARSKHTQSDLDQTIQINQALNGPEQEGTAARVEVEFNPSYGQFRAYHQQAEDGFQNDAATISAGRKESGIKLSMPAGKLGLARMEAIRTEQQNNEGVRTGASVSLERQLFKRLSMELGLRHYAETDDAATVKTAGLTPYNGTTGRVKLTGHFPWKVATAFLEYEQDVSDAEKHVVSVGGTAKVTTNTELYARHELISAIDGLYSLNSSEQTNTTLFGISSQYAKDATAFSEYRVADGMSDRDAEVALGLRNRWEVQPRVYVNTSFERVQSVSKNSENSKDNATAASLGLEYLVHEHWKAMTRIEARHATSSNTWLNTIAFARKLSDDMTLLTKNTVNFVDSQSADQGDHFRNRFQLGLAWRDQDENKLDLLSKLEHYYEDNAINLSSAFTRQAYVASLLSNYHPEHDLTLSGQYAAKWSELNEYGVSSHALTQLLAGRILYDLSDRWDIGFNAGLLWGNQGAGARYLVGAELGYLIANNFWVSAGYNVLGYQDSELANTSSTGQGAYLRFRFKFDEDLFGRRHDQRNTVRTERTGTEDSKSKTFKTAGRNHAVNDSAALGGK